MRTTPILAAKRLLQDYCRWADTQANNQKDFLLLGLGPLFLVALVLWLLPAWLGTIAAFVLLLPALYVVFIVLRAYAIRGGRK